MGIGESPVRFQVILAMISNKRYLFLKILQKGRRQSQMVQANHF
jgi:hypothetical protein